MILTYTLFSLAIMAAGLITALSIIRSGQADSNQVSAVLYIPDENQF
jgi:hypothetical protein